MPLPLSSATSPFDGSSFPNPIPLGSSVGAMLCDCCSEFAKTVSSLLPEHFELRNHLIPEDYRTFIIVIQHPLPRASALRYSAGTCALCSFMIRNISGSCYTESDGVLDTVDTPIEISLRGSYVRPAEFRIHSCTIWLRDRKECGINCWLYTNSGE